MLAVHAVGQIQQKAFDFFEYGIHQGLAGFEIIEHGSNGHSAEFGNFSVATTANATTGKNLDRMGQQQIFAFFGIQAAATINGNGHSFSS